jgi:hypothetical protein
LVLQVSLYGFELILNQIEGWTKDRAVVKDLDGNELFFWLPQSEWASLRREEGYASKISLAFVSPEQTLDPLMFERPLPIEPAVLTRIAPAVERAGIHLGVWHDSEGGLFVWGAAREIPKLTLVVEAAAPGLIVVKNQSGAASGKFINVAVLEGDQVKVVNRQTSAAPEPSSLLNSLLGFDSSVFWETGPSISCNWQSPCAPMGIEVVPSETHAWRDSIVPPIPYALSPTFRDWRI